MTIHLDLSPDLEDQVRKEAARRGQEPADYVRLLVETQVRLQGLESLKNRKRPQSLADLKPRIPSPAGSNGLDQVIGQWPGTETDEDIQDLWIAATAHATGARLLTTDKDFDHLHPAFVQRDWIDPRLAP